MVAARPRYAFVIEIVLEITEAKATWAPWAIASNPDCSNCSIFFLVL
jgi:hypothetical protein